MENFKEKLIELLKNENNNNEKIGKEAVIGFQKQHEEIIDKAVENHGGGDFRVGCMTMGDNKHLFSIRVNMGITDKRAFPILYVALETLIEIAEINVSFYREEKQLGYFAIGIDGSNVQDCLGVAKALGETLGRTTYQGVHRVGDILGKEEV